MVEEQGRQTADEKEGRKPWTLREFGGKTLWDWLQLLIVPVVLSLITVVFAWQQDIRQDQIENKRAKAERELAEQRAQDEALQAYLNEMSTLILEKDLRHAVAGDEMPTVARARTLTVLERLDPSRKTAVIQFITEARLVQGTLNQKGRGGKAKFEEAPVISLSGADLSGTDMTKLGGIGGRIVGSSRGVYYFGAGGFTYLDGADFSSADLSGANLSEANLSNANLSFANLSVADLSGVNLSGVEGIKNEELEQRAETLEGATMPNGQQYEEWLKSKGKREK